MLVARTGRGKNTLDFRSQEPVKPVNSAPQNPFHVVVLAAGSASRFGSAKQLATYAGQPLLLTAVQRAVALAGSAVTVVLGAHAAEIAPLLRRTPATLRVNRHWEEGLGNSLRLAARSLTGACEGLLVLLGDQPTVTADDLHRLVTAWQIAPERIAAAHYAGTTGVPAIFPRWTFAELSGLKGDQGARLLLHRHAERVERVPMPNAALDVDTPEDLQRIAPPA